MMFEGVENKFLSNQITPLDNSDAVRCSNQSGELIPPRSVVKLGGTFTSGARDVVKPDEDSLDSSLLLFTGEQAVPIGAEFFATNSFEVLQTLKTGDTPAVGDDIGTLTDTWTLTTDSTGMIARGASGGYVYAVPFSGGGASGVYVDWTASGGQSVNAGSTTLLGTYNIDLADQIKVNAGDVVAIVTDTGFPRVAGSMDESLQVEITTIINFYSDTGFIGEIRHEEANATTDARADLGVQNPLVDGGAFVASTDFTELSRITVTMLMDSTDSIFTFGPMTYSIWPFTVHVFKPAI